jgi:hypothetical protein
MFINQIDNLLDDIINKLNLYLQKIKIFDKIIKDTNFVKFHNEIMTVIKNFFNTINKNDISKIIKNEDNLEYILNIIKRYTAYYIYLGIAYYYKGDRDLFITNILESSKSQKTSIIQIQNFFNSENNSKIIYFYTIIKNILKLLEFKTIDRIKIIMKNNPVIYDTTIKLFNQLGEDYIVNNFIVPNNFHNIIKTLIFKIIYLKEEKNNVIDFLNQKEEKDSDYKYIEIVVSSKDKIADFSVLRSFLTPEQIKAGLDEEIYNYMNKIRDEKRKIELESNKSLNILLTQDQIIPITEDFLRYHKKTEKYTKDQLIADNVKERDATKIKIILNKINKIKNLYSLVYEKNAKLKLDALSYFYKQMEDRKVLLYNDDEEVKIINKLEFSDQASDVDLLIDLENIRKYCYENFKDFNNDGFKIRPKKTIQAIRNTSINNKKTKLELRITNDNINSNVIGLAWNPSKIPLDCFNSKDMINVRKLYKNDNGYKSFTKVMKKTYDTDKKNIYYWIFDNKNDIIKLDEYKNVSSLNKSKYIKNMLEEVFNLYINLLKNKIQKSLDNQKNLTITKIYNTLNYYKKYYDFNLNPEIKNNLLNNSLSKIKEIKVTEDEVDNIIPGKNKDIILLPDVSKEIEKENIIMIEKEKDSFKIEEKNNDNSICYHYIKWSSVLKTTKKDDKQNQGIFDFVKKYVRQNTEGEFVCKSCGEILNLKKYVYEGTYIAELDTFMTTSLAVNQNLNEIKKYEKYSRTIRNIEKNIEKICSTINLNYYIGNLPTTKLYRKLLIKDIIDLILIHSEYLKSQPKNRIEIASKNYNINKNLTNLFFFPLKDDIFITSSEDTDYYKIIKYNNVMGYIVLLLISELNSGQILLFKDDKNCNYFIFSKIKDKLLGDLFIRVSKKEKISLSKMPILGYVIFYFSCILTNNNIWLWNNKNDQKGYNIIIQKTIINTVIDLINTIIEANFDENKNYLYEIISTRLTMKFNSLFNDKNLLEKLTNKSMSKIKIDTKTKKISFITKKINLIKITGKYNNVELFHQKNYECKSELKKLTRRKGKITKNNISPLTNCPDGQFHDWNSVDNQLKCSKCGQTYSEVLKKSSKFKDTNDYNTLKKIRFQQLKKLTKNFCISGESHDIDFNTNICKLCNINPNTAKYTEKQLQELNKNLKRNQDKKILESINNLIKSTKTKKVNDENMKIIMNKFNKRYNEYTKNILNNYISDFIEKLKKIIGKKIIINNDEILLDETIYIVDHDFTGTPTKNKIFISSKDQKLEIEYYNKFFKTDVIHFKNNKTRKTLYYNLINKNYIGFSENNKNFSRIESNVYLNVVHSVKDMLINLGLDNEFYDLYYINSNYKEKFNNEIFNKDKKIIMEQIVLNRSSNLKFIISKIISIINSIKFNKKNNNIFFTKENEIINEFRKVLKKFKMKDKDNHKSVFKHHEYIINKITMNEISDNIKIKNSSHYLDTKILNQLNNLDSKLIFFLIFSFERFIDYNSLPTVKSNICLLIVKLIKYSFNQFYIDKTNYQLGKFEILINYDKPIVDEQLTGVGIYQEILNQEELNDPEKKEKDYSMEEAFNSLDIDDYEINDDIDGSIEALN